jgi:hypothetical protein
LDSERSDVASKLDPSIHSSQTNPTSFFITMHCRH